MRLISAARLSIAPSAVAFARGAAPLMLSAAIATTVMGAARAAAATPLPPQRPGVPAPAAPKSQAGNRLPLANVPLPPPRPMDLGAGDEETEEEHPAQAAVPPASSPATLPASGSAAPPVQGTSPPPPPPVEAAKLAPGELPAICAALVEQQMLLAERAPAVEQRPGCSLPVPIRLNGVRMADGNVAAFSPPAILKCEAAAAIATWVREDIAPAVAALGTRLETVRVADSYNCRPRNRVRGSKMSEHGMGNAFDTYGFVLADKRVLDVKSGNMPLDFQNAMKASVCARFSTVLGPGSDGFHEDHVHVDLAVRRLDIRLCKWTIKTPAPVAARTEPQQAREKDAGAGQGEPTPQGTQAASGADAEPDGAAVPLPPRRPASLRVRSAPPG